MKREAVLVACLLAVSSAGCGSGDRERDVSAVAHRFHAALMAGDGLAACAELSTETASKLEQQERKPCEEAILAVQLPKGGSVDATGVYVESGYASLTEGVTDFLSDGPGGWKIAAAGCRRTASEQPYDCELEG